MPVLTLPRSCCTFRIRLTVGLAMQQLRHEETYFNLLAGAFSDDGRKWYVETSPLSDG